MHDLGLRYTNVTSYECWSCFGPGGKAYQFKQLPELKTYQRNELLEHCKKHSIIPYFDGDKVTNEQSKNRGVLRFFRSENYLKPA